MLIFSSFLLALALLLILMFIDFLLCVAIKLKFGGFDWKKYINFLKSGLGPPILVWAGLSLVGIGVPFLAKFLGADIGLEAIIPITSIIGLIWGAILYLEGKEIIDKFKMLGYEIQKRNTGE